MYKLIFSQLKEIDEEHFLDSFEDIFIVHITKLTSIEDDIISVDISFMSLPLIQSCTKKMLKLFPTLKAQIFTYILNTKNPLTVTNSL